MKAFEITATLLASLAWPIVVLIVVFVFREPLRRLGNQDASRRPLRRAKVGPVEVEWDSLDQARTEAAAETTADTVTTPSVSRSLGDLLPLAESHPTAAVMVAAQRLEQALAKALVSHGIKPLRYTLAHMIGDALEHDLITASTAKVMHSLRQLRNHVAHALAPDSVGVTPARATDYVNTVGSMVDLLTLPS
ncbi:DUF4145 domain-containing protein [Micromonospora fulviviridis]|uniref:DUF4145 domain-containing protein n=1 Tax=Micromonospora fulviviridis TaxID=47860 RepID=A0ABV2VWH6_9ACTN